MLGLVDDLTHDDFHSDRLNLFWRFVCERQAIWCRRAVEHQPPPWTADEILRTERFTNVYRELDPGTQYAIREILERHAPRPDKIFNVMVYRLIGRVETHQALGFQYLANFDPGHVENTLKWLRSGGRAPFTAAYMVSAYASMGSADKVENVVRLFANLHCHFDDLYTQITTSGNLADTHAVLKSVYGFGNFLAYQVLVDLLYPLCVYGGHGLLPYSHDEWASAGPGAKRGIAMLLRKRGRASNLSVMRWLREHQWQEFARLNLDFPYLLDLGCQPVPISLANIQNCLCEYHKYVKIREGTGRGRRKFMPLAASECAAQLSFGFDDIHST